MRKILPLALLLLALAFVPAAGDGPRHPPVPPSLLAASSRVRVAGNRAGACVFVAPRKALTARHVVLDERGESRGKIEVEIRVGGPHRGVIWSHAEVLRADALHDLALLSLDADAPKCADLGDGARLELGAPVFAVGAPLGCSPFTASYGFLASKGGDEWEGRDEFLWQSSNAIFYGNSGGPVFDANAGLLIGISVQGRAVPGAGLAPNVCFFVPSNFLRELIHAGRDRE